ncbi:TRAP-type C4-dicarboxylate transport system [Halalkalibacter wakoensis JCM 9140]|uniref:TRAP-type C4-dicarboxylate transport system n=1 Tax=Halalkalibacter wakoensis JCM 9140 TaxID=1236970 RepID=W4Q879_9BACI|nr:TRAP transporter small permease [Halalkalibacter wakoensis]GAE28276.1 TRAP-type C4-dicarboxylate transport system [Halalkalibacter wakoensis JCM 9140]
MKRIAHYLSYTLEFIIFICMTITVVTTFLQVFYRYVLKSPLSWSQEVLMISFVYLVLFGAALAVKNKEHLKVDLFDRAPARVQKLLRVLEFSIMTIFIGVFVYYGTLLVFANFESGTIVGFLPIQVAYVYMSLPISGLFMFYYLVKGVFK